MLVRILKKHYKHVVVSALQLVSGEKHFIDFK